MTNTIFNAKTGLIALKGVIKSLDKEVTISLVLDTGANSTVIDAWVLEALGYDLAQNPHKTNISTGNGTVEGNRLQVASLEALGYVKENAVVVTYPFPPEIKYDGALGLTFLRQHNICLHFKEGIITFA
jgi:predicted aspartyl protease